jgi:L-malate glycosyltransferase
MKILHTVESYAPETHGMAEVVQQISERLAATGHDVTIATRRNPARTVDIMNGVKIASFDLSGNDVRGISSTSGATDTKTEIARYQALLTDGGFDIIVNFAAQQWATDLALPLLGKLSARSSAQSVKTVFVPTGFSGLHDPAYAKYFERMKKHLAEYDVNIFLSNTYQDVEFARAAGIPEAKIAVIPNGASEIEFAELNTPEQCATFRAAHGMASDSFLTLLIGSHTGLKGHREAIRIFRAARIPNSHFLIIANTPKHSKRGRLCHFRCMMSAFFHRNIHVRTLSRETTVSAYKSADIFLFPSNIECSPLVIFEAMAAALPFAVTDVGNTKEITDWSHGGILLPTHTTEYGKKYAEINASATEIRKLSADDELQKTLGQNGRNAWKERFTWDRITDMYAETYAKLMQK